MSDKPRILIVHDDRNVAARLAERLLSLGHSCTFAADFETGKTLMATAPPTLLIASQRLGAYNGLHLIIRGRLDDPAMAAILVSDHHDPLIEAEAARHGAYFLARPEESEELLPLVARALAKDQV